MDVASYHRHVTALHLARRSPPLVGRLLADVTVRGSLALLDPQTGGELSQADTRPAFVLSTEGEATDGHIVRQFWDLSRAAAGGPGVPVLWGHDADQLLGQWQDLQVATLGSGPALVGRCYLDPEDPVAQHRRGQISRGILNAVSVGWKPGATTRRGDLAPTDPLYKEPEDGMCGPEEGLIMGTPEEPNELVECSLVSCPAQQEAVVTARAHERGAKALERAVRGEPTDIDALLQWLSTEPRVRAFLGKEIARAVREHLAKTPSPAPSRRLVDLLSSRS